MDGTAVDFISACKTSGMEPVEFKLKSGIYRRLPLMPGAASGIEALTSMGYLVFFLTKITQDNPGAASEKLHYVWEHFPEVGERVIISPDKGAVGTPRDILIDDSPHWANAEAFVGEIITFNGDWTATIDAA